MVEDVAESMGATYKGVQIGTFGKYNTISFNGNKIITGSVGGCFLTVSEEAANKVRRWSTQAGENAAWCQHEELEYNYRMSNVVASVVRGQFPYLNEHIAHKKAIYEGYKDGLKVLPVSMNQMDLENSEQNYWLSCLIIDKKTMCKQVHYGKDLEEPLDFADLLERVNAVPGDFLIRFISFESFLVRDENGCFYKRIVPAK